MRRTTAVIYKLTINNQQYIAESLNNDGRYLISKLYNSGWHSWGQIHMTNSPRVKEDIERELEKHIASMEQADKDWDQWDLKDDEPFDPFDDYERGVM